MATQINYRFLFDSSFFEEVLKGDYDLQAKLIYITSKAVGNKKRQNLISKKSRELIAKNNPKISDEVLRYFLNKLETPESIESEEDEIIRTLRYAIYLTSEWPFKVIIFTSEKNLESYKTSPHYQNVKTISFKCNEDAKEIIEYWFKKCREEVSHSCD